MKFNYSLDDMRSFCAVVRYGSFRQASVMLDMPLSTLSRRIAKLETDLGLRLLNRDAHRVQLTHAGQQYYKNSAHLFDELENVASCLLQDKDQAKGTIRISAPVNFGSDILAPHFNAFLKQYPDINLDLRLSNQTIDIDAQAIDIAFRIGEHSADHWIGRQLTHIRFMICAAGNIDVSDIRVPSDLAKYPTVLCTPMSTWHLQHRMTGEVYTYQPMNDVRLRVDNISLLTGAIADGIGLGFIPDYDANPLINSGNLQWVLPEWNNQPRGCQMLYRDRDNMPHRMHLLIDFILKRFGK